MSLDSQEISFRSDEADQEYRPINPVLIRCVLAEFTDLDFWGKLQMLRQAADEDPDCTYRTPVGFVPQTSQRIESLQSKLNSKEASTQVIQ